METLFFYGTLRHLPLLEVILGKSLDGAAVTPGVLPDFAVFWAAGESYPMIVPQAGARAAGLLVAGLDADALERLDFYEGGHGYALTPVQVETAQGPCDARVYLPPSGGPAQGAPWSLEDWITTWGELSLLAATEVMEYFGQQEAALVARRFPSIRARAASRLAARQTAPATLRHDRAAGDVQIDSVERPYAQFFSVEEFLLRHRQFDGKMGPTIHRAAFVSCDAATVLPYDPIRERVLLVEQFRTGPLARGDAQCWSLEAIAGRIDPGESAEETLRREAVEEAGLELDEMIHCHSYYPTPGAKTEYIFSYVGLADLPDEAAGLGGLPGEGEDIRAHVVSLDQAQALMDSGEIENGPLLITLHWLQRNRLRLRSGA